MNTFYEIMDIEDILPDEAILEICTMGQNDISVNEWVEQLSKKYLWNIKSLREQCVEYGLERNELDIPKDVKAYALWLAAWNVFENNYH